MALLVALVHIWQRLACARDREIRKALILYVAVLGFILEEVCIIVRRLRFL